MTTVDSAPSRAPTWFAARRDVCTWCIAVGTRTPARYVFRDLEPTGELRQLCASCAAYHLEVLREHREGLIVAHLADHELPTLGLASA